MELEAFPPLRAPNLLAAAAAATALVTYQSPRTDPQPSRLAAPVTRRAEAEGRAQRPPTMEERLDALKPHGRVQRPVPLSESEKRELHAEYMRRSRAWAKLLTTASGVFMDELSRYDLPLVQLQYAEFAVDGSNYDSRGASMRSRFLEQYGMCCHTKHTDVVSDVLELPVLARLLQSFKPARELLHRRLVAAKKILAEAFTGAHRMGRVEVDLSKTLTQLRIDIFKEQSRSGRTANELIGGGDFMPRFRVSKVKGKYTLEFRHQLHLHRHFSAKVPCTSLSPPGSPNLL